jgi:hypothetical protein
MISPEVAFGGPWAAVVAGVGDPMGEEIGKLELAEKPLAPNEDGRFDPESPLSVEP